MNDELNLSRELTRQLAAVTANIRVVPTVRLQCDSLPQAVQSGHYAAVLPTLVKPLAEASGIRVFANKRFASMGRDMDLIWNLRVERIRSVIAGLAEEMEKAWRSRDLQSQRLASGFPKGAAEGSGA